MIPRHTSTRIITATADTTCQVVCTYICTYLVLYVNSLGYCCTCIAILPYIVQALQSTAEKKTAKGGLRERNHTGGRRNHSRGVHGNNARVMPALPRNASACVCYVRNENRSDKGLPNIFQYPYSLHLYSTSVRMQQV